jgi:hypothetical protein
MTAIGQKRTLELVKKIRTAISMQFSRKQLSFFSILLYLLSLIAIGVDSVLTFTSARNFPLEGAAIFALAWVFSFIIAWIPRRKSPKTLNETFHTYEGGWMLWLFVARLGIPAAITIYALIAVHNQNYNDLFFAFLVMAIPLGSVCSEFFRTQSIPS